MRKSEGQVFLAKPSGDGLALTDPVTGGAKGSKPQRYDLIPPEALDALATVYGIGCQKYSDRNWERGYAYGLSFAAMMRHAGAWWRGEEIDKERGVVLEEWRGRLGASSRVTDQQLPLLFYGSKYADRLPIGLPDTLRTFPHERLRDFYRTWYRADRMAVVVAGVLQLAIQIPELWKKKLLIPPKVDFKHPKTHFSVKTCFFCIFCGCPDISRRCMPLA